MDQRHRLRALALGYGALWVGIHLSTAAASAAGRASGLPLSDRVREADDYFLGRQKMENVREGLELLRKQVAENPRDYEAWWRISKFTCFMGQRAAGPEKLRLLEEGINAGKKAVALLPNRVEGHFWLGANYGLTAEARNFLRAILMVDTVRREMETANRLGPDYEQAGGLRTLARVDYRAPFFKGGDKRRSVERLRDCLRRYPQNSLAMLYLADSLTDLGHADEARATLENILNLCPDPDYGPEFAENQAEARARLAKFSASAK